MTSFVQQSCKKIESFFQQLSMLENKSKPQAPSRSLSPADQRNPTKTYTHSCLLDKCAATSMNNKSFESSLCLHGKDWGLARGLSEWLFYSCLVSNSQSCIIQQTLRNTNPESCGLCCRGKWKNSHMRDDSIFHRNELSELCTSV